MAESSTVSDHGMASAFTQVATIQIDKGASALQVWETIRRVLRILYLSPIISFP